jgi:hypothetical protein
MKIQFILVLLLLVRPLLHAQGTFQYDQQSSTESVVFAGGAYIHQATDSAKSPLQSFTPALASVGFIRLYIADEEAPDALGAAIYINLRSDSITGPILASTATVPLPNSYVGTVNFLFNNNVPVTPQTTYYFEVLRQGGADTWTANISVYNYGGGTLYTSGLPSSSNPPSDMWFREGIVVPEPSVAWLALLGGWVFAWRCRKR